MTWVWVGMTKTCVGMTKAVREWCGCCGVCVGVVWYSGCESYPMACMVRCARCVRGVR